ncbi:MAG TPA: ribonuclease P protein component [Lacipirellulaceae bacterium]|nr:ribonuclease P protein component [Lacipirellulaceae bacterium]
MSELRFTKQIRILRSDEFERIFTGKKSVGNGSLVMYGATNALGHPRLGITVSRKVGGAVERNRWKRLLREAFRLSQQELSAIDLVCVVRAPIPPSLAQLMHDIQEMARRLDRKIGRAAPKSK